jgi:competence protein ComEC
LGAFFLSVRRDLRAHATVYVALIPALIPLGVPSALSIVCNLFFAPVMGFVLFPVSVLGYAGLATLADQTWSIALTCVKFAARLSPEPWSAYEFSPVWLLPYIFALSLMLFVHERRRVNLKMRLHSYAAVILILLATHPAGADELIVWNVGQGSWATLKSAGVCEHFDMGGEFAPEKLITRACASERNEVYFSHWDWDHIGLTRLAQKKLPNLCVQMHPGGETKSKTKLELIAALPDCESQSRAREIYGQNRGSANEESRVFTQDRIVFPGDSPTQQEARWRKLAREARILIAGHHGSKTSTSAKLLETLTHLKLILVSARKQKYGHPHPAMLARSREHLRPVLTTEDWGHIHVEVSGGEPQSKTMKTEFRIPEQPAYRFRVRDGGKNPGTR